LRSNDTPYSIVKDFFTTINTEEQLIKDTCYFSTNYWTTSYLLVPLFATLFVMRSITGAQITVCYCCCAYNCLKIAITEIVCKKWAGLNYKMHIDTLDAAYIIYRAYDEGVDPPSRRIGGGSQ
jgi:hypothetical protein